MDNKLTDLLLYIRILTPLIPLACFMKTLKESRVLITSELVDSEEFKKALKVVVDCCTELDKMLGELDIRTFGRSLRIFKEGEVTKVPQVYLDAFSDNGI